MQNEKRAGLKKRLSDRYSMTERISSRELVVIRGERSLTAYGCRKILLYSPCEIRLRLCKRILSVRGRGLFCTCFSAGSITLEGEIESLSYCCEEPARGGGRGAL